MSFINMEPIDFEKFGDQPIRVYTQLEFLFNDIKVEFSNRFPGNTIKSLKLSYLTENIKAIGPNVNQVRMQFHDTFLSFLWCYCYGLCVSAPMRGKPHDDLEYNKAIELLKYSKEIMFEEYRPWPTMLPNPENMEGHNKDFIDKANAVYTGALKIILFHEFAHVILGHVELNEKDISKQKLREFDADEFSIKAFLNFSTFGEMTRNMAIICAISSLAFGRIKKNDTSSHPEPEDRLTKILELLNYPNENYIWGHAWWAFIKWQLFFGWFYNPDHRSVGSTKNAYYAILEDFKNHKLLNSQ
jgi:hypothetical protein